MILTGQYATTVRARQQALAVALCSGDVMTRVRNAGGGRDKALRQLRPVLHPELPIDMLKVRLDGVGAEEKPLRDVFARES